MADSGQQRGGTWNPKKIAEEARRQEYEASQRAKRVKKSTNDDTADEDKDWEIIDPSAPRYTHDIVEEAERTVSIGVGSWKKELFKFPCYMTTPCSCGLKEPESCERHEASEKKG